MEAAGNHGGKRPYRSAVPCTVPGRTPLTSSGSPADFPTREGFLTFLAEPGMRRLMEEGRQASVWMRKHILAILDVWNSRGRHELERELGISTEELDKDKFIAFVGTGQTFLLHLAEFIHASILPALKQEAATSPSIWTTRTAMPDAESCWKKSCICWTAAPRNTSWRYSGVPPTGQNGKNCIVRRKEKAARNSCAPARSCCWTGFADCIPATVSYSTLPT